MGKQQAYQPNALAASAKRRDGSVQVREFLSKRQVQDRRPLEFDTTAYASPQFQDCLLRYSWGLLLFRTLALITIIEILLLLN